MKVIYGQDEAIEGTVLEVNTDYYAIVTCAVPSKTDYPLAFLTLEQVVSLIAQLTAWLEDV